MADARKDKRTLLSLKIRYKSATLEDFIERYSMDISAGGVFIKAAKPLSVGTLLKFDFILQDQSTLIHGVGRVAWRREENEADANNPAGMGIKFIKMDPESRTVVQRIVEERVSPGVFERGKEGVSLRTGEPSEPPQDASDETKVRHVSEFLASALEEGGAGETTMREARAGAERARHVSARGTAIGAFKRPGEPSGLRSTISDAPSRGASSAFGGSSVTAGASLRSSAAPAMDEYEDDDFVDNETTTVQQLPASAFPEPDADVTVIAAEAPFVVEKKQTPVVPPASEPASEPASPLESAVPDLFGPDSFGPAPGEVIDASLLDPGVATVPPKASALPRSAMPNAPGLGPDALQVPEAPKPAGVQPSFARQEPKSRVGLIVVLLLVLLAGGGVGAWQFGLLDGVVETLSSGFGASKKAPVMKAPPAVTKEPQPSEARAAEADRDVVAEADVEEESIDTAEEAAQAEAPEGSTAEASDRALVKLRVVSVPSGAFVTVDGERAGRTPLELERDSGAKLSVYAKARGFLGRRQQVTVDPSKREVKLVLSPLPYQIEVATDPPGALASAVGGGEIVTPGTLEFRSMPASRKIVVSKDGFVTVTKLVTRRSFVEERSRMVASVNLMLTKEGGSQSEEAAATEAPATPAETTPVAPAEPAPSEPADDGDAP